MASSAGCKASCPLCLESCNDASPACSGVVNACQACAVQKEEGSKEDLSFLQSGAETSQEERCGQTTGREILQLMTWLRFQAARESAREPMCEKHQEPLKVFCMEDRALICLVCDKSRKHRTHTVLPVEEAAQDYKKEIQIRLESLKVERNAVQEWKLIQKEQTAKHLEDLKIEREKIVLEFQHLHNFLEEQQKLLLAQLSELEKEVEQMQVENSTKLSDTFSCLSDLISDLEKNYQRPALEFLQDLKKALSGCEKEKFHWLVESPLDLEKKLKVISQKSIILTENLEAFKETLAVELKGERTTRLNTVVGEQGNHSQVCRPVMYGSALRMDTKVNVTLDPRTANPQLIVSRDQKSVRHSNRPEVLPDNPERFDTELFVLGCEGFGSGRHCWVVDVERGQNWAIGIARQSVRRKGYVSLSPEQGIWAVEQCWGHFQALTSPWTSLSLFRKPRRIQVCVDYERGLVAFFDADLDAPIFSFHPISFKCEKIYPWLWVGPRSHLSICL